MARKPAPGPILRRDDESGQMMILAAVILVVGFLALAGLVSRVNELATSTAQDAEKLILSEVAPLTDIVNGGVADLRGGRTETTIAMTQNLVLITSSAPIFFPQDVGRHIDDTAAPDRIAAQTTIASYVSPTSVTLSAPVCNTGTCTATGVSVNIGFVRGGTTSGSATVTAPADFFRSSDVGQAVAGAGIPAGARIVTFNDPMSVVMSAAATATSATVDISIGRFALTATSAPSAEMAVRGHLEQVQRMEAAKGLAMDYSIGCTTATGASTACGAAADCARSQVTVHLADGDVWIEVKSTALFVRGTSCTVVSG